MDEIHIGILIGNICATHSDNLLNGILHGTEGKNIHTLFFMGAHANCFDELYYYNTDSDNKEKYIFQFNTVFDYANLGKLDLLIIAYSTFYLYTSESKESFFERFKDLNIPIMIIGDEYLDYTGIIADNVDGIRKCMEHLLDVHGCRKIGFLSGPRENNKDARERLEAYRNVLEERGLPIEDSLIEYGDYSANSAKFFGKILDNNPGIDAIVCANDTMALAGYEECKLRGLVPGVDIAITGFDDIQEAKSAIPKLTTVEQNTYDMGYMAMKKAIDILENHDMSSVKVPVYFKHRESCGSAKETLREKLDRKPGDSMELLAAEMSRNILDRAARYKSSLAEDSHLSQIIQDMLLHIMKVYSRGEKESFDFEYIALSLRELIRSDRLNTNDFQVALGEKLSEIMLLRFDQSRQSEMADILLHIIDVTSGIQTVCFKDKMDMLQKNIWTTPFITREMITHIDDEKRMYQSLMERLRMMKIENAYMFLLPQPVINEKISDWKCPEQLNLACKIENGIIQYSGGHTKLNSKNGITDVIRLDDCHDMAVYSLFSGTITYGILICQMTPDNITSMYSVGLHIGSAFQFIALMRNQRKIQTELEQAMTLLKNRNDILNMISEKDELTQIYNRRGFLENAINKMKQAKNCYLFCIYADLDHLKQINDQFGHQEGDFAIKQAAQYLKNSLRSSDIVGRVGGDEFAALAVITREDMGEKLYDRIIMEVKSFNQNSDKPYYIEVSIGYSVNKWTPELELDKMLSAADLMLYENKKKRRKDARKIMVEEKA